MSNNPTPLEAFKEQLIIFILEYKATIKRNYEAIAKRIVNAKNRANVCRK